MSHGEETKQTKQIHKDEGAGNRTATGRDEKRHEPPRGKDRCPRILLPSPRGKQRGKRWQREACIMYTVARLVNVGILLLWITFSGLHPASPLGGHRIRGSTQTGVVAGFGSTLSGIRLRP